MKKIKQGKKEQKENKKRKKSSLDKTGSEKYEKLNNKGKHDVEQKDNMSKKNVREKSTKKEDAEKTMNDDLSEIVRDFEDGNYVERSDDRRCFICKKLKH